MRRLEHRQRVIGAVAVAAALVTAIALVGGSGTSKVSTKKAVTNPVADEKAEAADSGPATAPGADQPAAAADAGAATVLAPPAGNKTGPAPTPALARSSSPAAASRPSTVASRPPARAAAASDTPAGDGHGGPGPHAWAVIVGVQDYSGSTHDTYGGDGDANAISELLRRKGWPDDHVLRITDGAATADGIRKAMHWLVDHSADDAFTLFHYSGHVCIASTGPCGSGHTWLWGSDNHFVSDDEVGSTLSGLRGWSWVDIAGCEADAFDRGIASPQRLFTASSKGNEKSYEYEPWHESVWTGLTVDQGMLQNHADTNGDGKVSVQEAARYGQQQAPGMTQDAPQGPQHPVIAGGDGDGWFLDIANPTGHRPQNPPPSNGGGGGGQPPQNPPAPVPCGPLKGVLHC